MRWRCGGGRGLPNQLPGEEDAGPRGVLSAQSPKYRPCTSFTLSKQRISASLGFKRGTHDQAWLGQWRRRPTLLGTEQGARHGSDNGGDTPLCWGQGRRARNVSDNGGDAPLCWRAGVFTGDPPHQQGGASPLPHSPPLQGRTPYPPPLPHRGVRSPRSTHLYPALQPLPGIIPRPCPVPQELCPVGSTYLVLLAVPTRLLLICLKS